MRNLPFKIISPSELLESTSVNLWRAFCSLSRNLPGVFLLSLFYVSQLSSLKCQHARSLESFKNTSDKLALLWKPLGSL